MEVLDETPAADAFIAAQKVCLGDIAVCRRWQQEQTLGDAYTKGDLQEPETGPCTGKGCKSSNMPAHTLGASTACEAML